MLYTHTVFVALPFFLATLSVRSGNIETPNLVKNSASIQLMVNGKPFFILGGELGNSSASSLDDLNRIFRN